VETAPPSSRIPLAEETVRVDKKDVVTGKVVVRTVSETTEQIVRERLEQEAVEVTRVPIEVEVQTPPQTRRDGDTLIVPVLEERLVIEKRLFVVEELHIRRRVSQDDVEVTVPVRKQRAIVERIDEHGTTPEHVQRDAK